MVVGINDVDVDAYCTNFSLNFERVLYMGNVHIEEIVHQLRNGITCIVHAPLNGKQRRLMIRTFKNTCPNLEIECHLLLAPLEEYAIDLVGNGFDEFDAIDVLKTNINNFDPVQETEGFSKIKICERFSKHIWKDFYSVDMLQNYETDLISLVYDDRRYVELLSWAVTYMHEYKNAHTASYNSMICSYCMDMDEKSTLEIAEMVYLALIPTGEMTKLSAFLKRLWKDEEWQKRKQYLTD